MSFLGLCADNSSKDKDSKTASNADSSYNKIMLYGFVCLVAVVLIVFGFFSENMTFKILFIGIGLILLMIFAYPLYSFYIQWSKLSTASQAQWTYPGADYMLGPGQCPDGWVARFDTKKGQVKCLNINGIQVAEKNIDKCLDPVDENGARITKTFNRLTSWPPESATDIKTRCEWTQRCGVNPHTPATWTGLGCAIVG